MTREVLTPLPPDRVLAAAKRFYTDEDAVVSATIVDESDTHVTLATFRSRIAVSAFPDPEGRGTRVRFSTLRPDDSVGKFLEWIRTAGAAGGEPAGSG